MQLSGLEPGKAIAGVVALGTSRKCRLPWGYPLRMVDPRAASRLRHRRCAPPQKMAPKYPRTHVDELKPWRDLSERVAKQNNSTGKDRA